jgi:hypothetical protein
MKKIVFTALALSSLIAKSQVMIGTNSKVNELVGGVNFNGYGYYIMGSVYEDKEAAYNIPQGEGLNWTNDAIGRGDIKIGEATNKSGFSLMMGVNLTDEDDINIGVHIGMKHTTFDYYNVFEESRKIGTYGYAEDDYKYLVGKGWTNKVEGMIGVNVRVKCVFANLNISKNEKSVQFGLALPLGEMGSCGRF